MAKRRNRRALSKGKATKKTAAKRKTKAAKRPAKKAKAKTAALVKKLSKAQKEANSRGRKSVIKATIPQLAIGYLVRAENPNTDPVSVGFLAGADTFIGDPSAGAVLFDSRELAQKQIDDMLILAEAGTLAHFAKVELASDYLETSYAFDPIPDAKGELGLDARLAVKGKGKSFKDALSTIRGVLKAALVETKQSYDLAVKTSERFKEQWG